MHIVTDLKPRARRCQTGFTLVELLVVIGIIALLIGILLPSVGVARQAAQRVDCSAKLRQQLVAAQLHVQDHKGFYPLTGVLPGIQPADLDDPYATKYSYFSYPYADFTRMIAPITISLASEMTYGNSLLVLSNDAVGKAETDDQGFIRNFLCPSQASSVSELSQLPMEYLFCPEAPSREPYIVWYTEAMSYVYNEAALGWGEYDKYNRAKGRASQIHQPSRTMFVADGLGGYPFDPRFPYQNGDSMATVYNIATVPPITMADAFAGNGSGIGLAGDRANFDLVRHHGKINIGFFDGHVETRNITPADLASVYLMAP